MLLSTSSVELDASRKQNIKISKMGDPRQNDGHQDIPNLTPGTPSISIKTFQDVVHKWVEGHELNSKEQLAVFHKLIDILCDQNLKDWSGKGFILTR